MNYRLTTVAGGQFGDEGKGKVTQNLASQFDIVARFGGGPNAGHTAYHEDRGKKLHKVVTHVVPSGILSRNVLINFIGPGCVIDPVLLQKEIQGLMELGLPYHTIYLSELTPLITPWDCKLDAMMNGAIDTTRRGIGPTYAHKRHRRALRVGDFIEYVKSPKTSQSWDLFYQESNRYKDVYDTKAEERLFVSIEEFEPWFKALVWLTKNINIAKKNFFLRDGDVHKVLEGKKDVRILAEGAQAVMLDNTFGTYPFVTSSDCMPSAAIGGIGLPPGLTTQEEVVLVFKAYSTRVGNGPFDTEIEGDLAEKIRQAGGEYGSTTKRPRRIGWLDLPDLKYAIELTGATKLYMTKVDVLSAKVVSEVLVCVRKDSDGKPTEWKTFKPFDVKGVKKDTDINGSLFQFISFLEESLGQHVDVISVGPLMDDLVETRVTVM